MAARYPVKIAWSAPLIGIFTFPLP
jgi:hypothetical protein